jgi:hypothetical protein
MQQVLGAFHLVGGTVGNEHERKSQSLILEGSHKPGGQIGPLIRCRFPVGQQPHQATTIELLRAEATIKTSAPGIF